MTLKRLRTRIALLVLALLTITALIAAYAPHTSFGTDHAAWMALHHARR